MKRLITLALAMTLAIGLGVPLLHAQETIKVGVILAGSQSGNTGIIEKNSFNMAMEKINTVGGIDGKKLEFIFEEAANADVARSAAEKLITRDKVVMLTGGSGSPEAFAAAGIAQQNGIPFLVSQGADNKITEQGWNNVFRMSHPIADYNQAVETFLKEVVKPQTAAILFENTSFGISGSKEFKDLCDQLGIKIVVMEGYTRESQDFKPLLTKVKQANPDIIYMVSYVKDAGLLMTQSMELHLAPKVFIGGGAGFTVPEFQKRAGKAAEMVYSATLWYQTVPYSGASSYYDEFVRKFGMETQYHGAKAYAAAFVIYDVFCRAKSTKPEDVREALAATDIKTIFGPVKFVSYNKMTNQNRLPTYLVQWMNGKQQLVWPKESASDAWVYPIDWERVWK